MFVLQLADEPQLVFDLHLDLRGHSVRPPPAGTFVGDAAQITGRRFVLRHDLVRILIFQLVERERAAIGHAQRLGHQLGREGLRQPQARAQVAFGVDLQLTAALRQRATCPRRRHHVVQRLARAHVHVDVPHRHQRNRGKLAGLAQLVEPHLVVQLPQQLHAEPAPASEVRQQPAREHDQVIM